MANEIEKLFVSIGADTKELLRDTKKGVDQAEGQLKKFERAGINAFKKVGASGKRAFAGIGQSVKKFAAASKRAFGQATKAAKGLFTGLKSLPGIVTAMTAAFSVAKVAAFFKESLDLTKTQIAAEKQLETVLASTGGAAGLTAEELKKMASELQNITNFGDESIIAGQSLLLTFTKIGRDVFPRATKAMLDVSTAMGQDMKVSAIQIGKALNDPITGLQNLRRVGIQFTKQQEKQIKTMTEAGEIAKAQGIILDELERQFGGSAEAAREADGGMIAFSNTIGDLQEVLGLPIFEEIQEQFGRLNDTLGDEEVSEAITEIATALGETAAALMGIVSSGALDALEDVDIQTYVDFAESLARAAEAMQGFTDSAKTLESDGSFSNFVELIQFLADSFTIVVEGYNKMADGMGAVGKAGPLVGQVLGEIKDIIIGMVFPVARIVDSFADLNKIYSDLTGQEIQESTAEIATEMQDARKEAEEFAAAMEAAYGGTIPDAVEDGTDEVEDGTDEMIDALEDGTDKLKDILSGLGSEFIDLQESTNEKLADLQIDHADKMADLQEKHQEKLSEIAANATKARTKANQTANEDLLKLEKETNKERRQIIADAKQELADLEEATDKQIEDERENFDTNELRQTEDHLREMRRARQQYLDSLEDVVKNRDARALVDLRRRYQREQDEAQEAFGTGQRRAQEDQDRRLAEIREGEKERADAIIETRERDLQSLIEAEAEKRREIQKTLADELAQIDIQEQEKIAKEEKSFDERVERENEQFAKRQEELQGALQERLEAEAKALADQEEITEDGARAILEALNETFGIGGDIDELMDAFMERRRAKMLLKIEFETQLGTPPPTPAGTPGGGSAPMGGSPPLTEMFQFQHGGSMVAKRPTMAMFGEAGPELATFTPLSQMNKTTSATKRVEVDINMRGSAPPGIRSADRDEIAGVLVGAMREAGIFAS